MGHAIPSLVLALVAGMSTSSLLTGPAAATSEERDATNTAPTAPTEPDSPEGAEPGSSREPLRVCPIGDPHPGCRYHGLQNALAAALPGDRVVLAPGIYEEGAIVTTSGLVLQGEAGAHLRGHAVEGKAALVVKADD